MSAADIDRHLEDAQKEDRKRDPEGKQMPVAAVMTTLMFAGRDSSGTLCPVFAMRLRSPDGRVVADSIRQTMQDWAAS